MKQTRMMLDGMRSGTQTEKDNTTSDTESRLEVSKAEKKSLEEMMVKAGATVKKNVSGRVEWIYQIKRGTVKAGSIMCLALRENKHIKGRYYLNLSGNPLSFLTGNNVYGDPNPVGQLKECWTLCLDRLEKKSSGVVDKKLREKVEKGEIHIHSLEWACYTRKIENLRKMIERLKAVYRLTHVNVDGESVFIDKMLNFQTIDSHYEGSFRLKILDSSKKVTHMFCMYDKLAEMEYREETGEEVQVLTEEIRNDVEDRLRIDIDLQPRWFEQRKVRTLNDLEDYVRKKYDSWKLFVKFEIRNVMERIYLKPILEMDGEQIMEAISNDDEKMRLGGQEVKTEIMQAILFARVNQALTKDQQRGLLRGDKECRTLFNKTAKKVKAMDVTLKLDSKKVVKQLEE